MGSGVAGEGEEEQKKQEEKEAYEMEVVDAVKHRFLPHREKKTLDQFPWTQQQRLALFKSSPKCSTKIQSLLNC